MPQLRMAQRVNAVVIASANGSAINRQGKSPPGKAAGLADPARKLASRFGRPVPRPGDASKYRRKPLASFRFAPPFRVWLHVTTKVKGGPDEEQQG